MPVAKELESGLVSTKDLTGKKVWVGRPQKGDPDAVKKMGRVRACVFHPTSKRCVGFLVKRPDVALMFHRADLFVAVNGYDVVDGFVVVRDDPAATDRGACKALGIDLDDCVLWVGLPAMCEDGTDFGTIDNVWFHPGTGDVDALEVSRGATANTLLGKRRVPAADIRGFRRGMGTQLYVADDGDERALGAIVVSDAVKDADVQGGVAEKAGAATAVAADKAKRAAEKAKPKVKEASAVAGKAVEKGVYATGRQIGRTKGMFSSFKNEFNKALHDDGE